MEDRKLMRLSAYAEIISSIAVLITLVYLAIQTRQVSEQTELNTAAILASTRQQGLDSELSLVSLAMSMSDNEFYRQITAEQNAITDDFDQNRMEVGFYYVAQFRIRENLWLQYRNGVLDETTWLTYRTSLLNSLRQEGFTRTLWDSFSVRNLNPEFVAEINALINTSSEE